MSEDRIQEQYKQSSSADDSCAGQASDCGSEQGASMQQGKPEQLKGKLKQIWSRLSDEDISLFSSGKQDQFFDQLEQKHGVARDEAEEKIEGLKKSCASSAAGKAA